MPRKILLLFVFVLFQFIVYGQRVTTLGLHQTPIRLGMPDTCSISTSEQLYGGPGNDYATFLINTSDGGTLSIGYTNSFGAGGYDGYIIKLDNLGGVQWSKAYGGPSDDEFTVGRQTADGGYILAGYTTSYGDPADAWLVKVDANGNLQWSGKYGDGNPWGERIWDLIQTADGGYAFDGDHKYIPGVVDAMVVRVDANGNLLWAKGFDSGGSDESAGIYEDRDSLVVSAFYQSATGYDAVLMKLEETAGNIAWLQSWDFDGRTNRVGYVYPTAGGYLVEGVNSDGYGVLNPWPFAMKTDFNGNLNFIEETHVTPLAMNGFIYPTADSGYIIEHSDLEWNPINADVFMTKVQKDGTIDWSRSYPQPGYQQPAGVVPAPGGGYTSLAFTNQGGANYHFMTIKTDSAGLTSGCPYVTNTAINRVPVVTDLTYSWASVYSIAFNPATAITPVVTNAVTGDTALCLDITYCKDLTLTGVDTICNMQAPQTYDAIRDSGCVSPVQWTVDPAHATILTQTDSTVQLQYLQTGAVTLYGQITSVCGILQDSLQIQVYQPTPIALGNDTSFCEGGMVVLDAGPGFATYSWSNGQVAEQIIDSVSGTVWVSAVNASSRCISSDTIAITVLPSPIVQLGPDITICQDSTHKFDAGSGDSLYLWQDGSTNSYDYGSTPGTYRVTVTGQNGCSITDSARILALAPNPKDFLEPTAMICSKGQLPIDVTAIGRWAGYLWSTGSTEPTITISSPGQYWLRVTSDAGCSATDTIDIGGKACPFGIFFPNAFTPNNGTNFLFRPIVYAVLDKFYMAVYNRWGVMVFETTDPSRGWDGTFNGQPQPNGTYVWYAQYQLESGHGEVTVQKGTVMLLR